MGLPARCTRSSPTTSPQGPPWSPTDGPVTWASTRSATPMIGAVNAPPRPWARTSASCCRECTASRPWPNGGCFPPTKARCTSSTCLVTWTSSASGSTVAAHAAAVWSSTGCSNWPSATTQSVASSSLRAPSRRRSGRPLPETEATRLAWTAPAPDDPGAMRPDEAKSAQMDSPEVRNASPSMGVAAGGKYVGRHWSPLGPAGARGGTHVRFVHDGQEVNEMATNTTSRTLALAAVGLMVAATTAACSGSSTGSSSTGSSSSTAATAAETGVIAGLDYGPLVGLIGTWKSAPNGGVDVAPGQAGSKVGKGKPAVSPYYETITYTPAGGAVNASEQHLTALYYRQQVFSTSDNKQFHDQTGYLIYDKQNQKVYDTFCIPRGVCVVAEGAPGTTMTLKTQSQGVAETQYMLNTPDDTQAFSVTFTLSGNTLKYEQTTDLQVYGKPFSHTDSDTLGKTGG